jgi:hypothetical protein
VGDAGEDGGVVDLVPGRVSLSRPNQLETLTR